MWYSEVALIHKACTLNEWQQGERITQMSGKAGFPFDLITSLGISLSKMKINSTSSKHVHLGSCTHLSIGSDCTIVFTYL